MSTRSLLATIAAAAAAVLFSTACSTTARYKPGVHGPEPHTERETAAARAARAAADPGSAQAASARQTEAIEIGKRLFNDTGLGTNGMNCNSCHPGGGTTGGEAEIQKRMGHGPYKLPVPSLIGAAARFPKFKVPNDEVITLAQMNNNCVRMFMKGKRMPLDSPESAFLATYVTSLSEGEEVQVGGSMSQSR